MLIPSASPLEIPPQDLPPEPAAVIRLSSQGAYLHPFEGEYLVWKSKKKKVYSESGNKLF